MRKTTAYSRKRMHTGQRYNPMAPINAIIYSRQYTDEPIPGLEYGKTQADLDRSRNEVNRVNGLLARGAWGEDGGTHFNLLAEALGITLIRCLEIAGDKQNEHTEAVRQGSMALKSINERFERLGKWGATREEQIAISDALLVYEAILQASSPKQIQHALEQRLKALAERFAATNEKPKEEAYGN